MKMLNRALVCSLACCAALSAFGWGDQGHRTIGAMADQLITGTEAGAQVHTLLGDETLSAASVWADQVKGRDNLTPEMIQFTTANPNHFVFHYTDVPFEEPRYRDDSVGATNVDVVHAIPACILILQGRGTEQTFFKDVSPKVALRLLAHYIEDLHQPLHVGSGYLDGTNFVDPNGYGKQYKSDQGGNLLVFDGTNKLHFFWDVTVVQLAMAHDHVQTPAEYAVKLLGKSPAPVWKDSMPLLDWDREWADESLALSAKVHAVTVKDEDDTRLDRRTHLPRPQWDIQELTPEYIGWARQTAEEQITKAGYRLAATLEAIWPNKQ
ncbi:MAG TPA: S1/P1 nuclease [Candidatus Saccharimonadales bacterium]|nr:S1/P1 nuclease [Candidatus Saccharimonadales bacterium]